MITLILKDGTELINDEALGMNLSESYEIQEIFDEVGHYDLFTKEKGWRRIHKRELKKIENRP